MVSTVGSGATVPFWRVVGMAYISYSNICANLVRNYLKEPFKSEALTCEKVHFSISKWDNGKNCEEKEEELKHKLIIASFCLFH
ncbi:hypothetical protein AAG906_004437 [Vitis piasezkii]